jgi:hypothetical protein
MERHALRDDQFARIEHLLPGRPGLPTRPAIGTIIPSADHIRLQASLTR